MNTSDNIKTKAFSGIIWKLMERVGAQLVSLIVSVVLARILLPEDYSVVSIVSIFFVFCNVFISGGLNTALVQKKDSDIIDYSTVLFVSLLMALILYVVMFFAAPYIASLYDNPILIPVIRAMSLMLFVTAYKGVVCAQVSSSLQFKNFFISTLVGTVISAFVGIGMAKRGYGAWALVAQQMTNAILDSFILTVTTRIRFKLVVSFSRLKALFSYGWKIFVASVISVIYDEIRPLIVGIRFSPVDLAYYNKGKSFPALFNSSLSDSISAVLFPVMSKFQDSKEEMLSVTRRYMKTSSYIIFPVLIGFLAVSDNFIKVVLTEKWLFASPYIKIFCVTFLFGLIQTGNLQVIRASGRSDLILKLEIVKKSIYFIVIALFVILSDSPYLLAVSELACMLIATLVNTYPNVSLVGYKYRHQVIDLLPNFVLAIAMGIVVALIGGLKLPTPALLVIQIVVGMGVYIGLSIVTRNSNFHYLLNFIKEMRYKA